MGAETTAEPRQPAPRAPDGSRPFSATTARARQVRIAVVGIAFLVALGVLVRQTIGSDEPTSSGDRSGGSSGGSSGSDDTAGQARSGTPSTGARTLSLPGPGAFDGFGRAGPDQLGVADSGRAWRAALGTWGIDRGRARLVAPEGGRFRSVAVIELDGTDVTVEVAATAVRPGCGLVFRYENPLNYWFVSAVPDLATWSIGYVAEGTVVEVGNLGVVSTAAGTVIGVRLEGSAIEALVDGIQAAAFDDPTLAGATGAGLLAGGNTPAGARWDNFVATAASRAGPSSEPPSTVPDDPAQE